jgi:broad specificity phosphatase PhoE
MTKWELMLIAVDDEAVNGTMIFIRHAKAFHNRYKNKPYEYPGPELSKGGIRQARKLRKFFLQLRFDRCYYSPFQRTRETALIVFGKSCNLEESSEWGEIGQDESAVELRDRIERWARKHFPKNGRIEAVVSHAGPIRAAIEIWAPHLVQHAVVYDQGNIVPEAGLVLMCWKSGKVVASELLSSNHTDLTKVRIFCSQIDKDKKDEDP